MKQDYPKFDLEQIPTYELDSLCRVILKACQEFYSDPKNVEAFQKWKEERNSAASPRD